MEWYYQYRIRAAADGVYDGDTITVDIDLGFNSWLVGQKLRLYGVDTPEIRSSDPEERGHARVVRDIVRDYIATANVQGRMLWIRSHKDRAGKYGRWLAELYIETAGPAPIDVNQELIDRGHAAPASWR